MGDVRRQRVGILVVSVRLEPGGGPLFAQLRAIDRLDATQQAVTVAGDAEAVVERVREWLSAVADGEPLAW